jgi:hypothetical protein
MEVSFFPVKFVDVAPSERAARDALLNAIDRRMYNFILPGETDDDGVTHAEQERANRRDQHALAAMAIRKTVAPPRTETLDHHVSLMHWLRAHGFGASLDAALPMPSPKTLFALADEWQKLLLALLPVDDDEESTVSDVADLIDQFRDWAARDLSMGIYVG